MNISLKNTYEGGERINEKPLIFLFENFLVSDEVEHFLKAARDRLIPSLVTSDKGNRKSPGRTSSNCWVSHDHNAVIEHVARRVSKLIDIPLINAESFQVVYYAQNQHYQPHYDAWKLGTKTAEEFLQRGGQRLVTCLFYLNDVEKGGATFFPKLDLEIKAKKGSMLLFHNCREKSSQRHPQSLHRAMPVLSGDKWACNLWFRERSYWPSERSFYNPYCKRQTRIVTPKENGK